MTDPQGRHVGATFLRNNLNKRSVGLDLKAPEGRDLFLRLAPRFDIVCENFRAGTADRLGIGYEAVKAVHPEVRLPVGLGFRERPGLALPGLGRLRRDRRGHVGHLRVQAGTGAAADRQPGGRTG